MDLKKICSQQQHYTRSRYYLGFADLYIARDNLETAGYDTEFLSDEDIQYIADLTKNKLELKYDEEELKGDEGTEIMFDFLCDVLHDTMGDITDSQSETIIVQTDDITMISYGDTVEEAGLNANDFLYVIKSDSFFQDIQEDVKGLSESQVQILDSEIRVLNKKVFVSKEEVEQFLKRFTDKYINVQGIIYKDELNPEVGNTNLRKIQRGEDVPQIETETKVQEFAKDFYVFGKDVEGKEVYIKVSERIGEKPFVFDLIRKQASGI